MPFYKLPPCRRKIYLILLICLLSACTQRVAPVIEYPRPDQATLNSDKAWYSVRFSLHREKDQEPDWYLGTLLAGEVIAPILDQYGQHIICWRVHRRAVRDQTGHVFSFIFYSSTASAAMIYQRIQENNLVAELHRQQLLLKVNYAPLTVNLHTILADTSDTTWPESVRQSWPFFMMGASQMWMAQVKTLKQETADNQAIEQRYQIIQGKLNELWQQQGQHALIHHLSALYAYRPVSVRF